MAKAPRAVLVTRPTPYRQLLYQHGTRDQARFFLETRNQSIEVLEEQHARFELARQIVSAAIPSDWRRARVERSDLSRFLFEPDDIVVVLGQDGLVANLAKYIEGQPVIGLDPDPGLNAGVLVRHAPQEADELVHRVADGTAVIEARTMVQAVLDDGQKILALNEIFIGHQTHQSARYQIRWNEKRERQSSSGIVVATGTGSTGWAASIRRERICDIPLPQPTDRSLSFFVREAWPSIATGTDITEGLIHENAALGIVSEMDGGGVVFGDGIEADHMDFDWGHGVDVRVSDRRLHLVVETTR
jgi:hypothetical protein